MFGSVVETFAIVFIHKIIATVQADIVIEKPSHCVTRPLNMKEHCLKELQHMIS